MMTNLPSLEKSTSLQTNWSAETALPSSRAAVLAIRDHRRSDDARAAQARYFCFGLDAEAFFIIANRSTGGASDRQSRRGAVKFWRFSSRTPSIAALQSNWKEKIPGALAVGLRRLQIAADSLRFHPCRQLRGLNKCRSLQERE
jgi:hypothetical protein